MEDLLIFTKAGALVYFFLIYCAILFWVFRGKNKTKFEEYAKIPLKED
ncbi:MAG: cbb3-type cytochrome c oxidase subunit 3 [Deltaproteobacteria bacterium]|nr:cbb3-type cytochrome c oxidase subunit 3 [Deltaproteobacteria bacterium]